ncbi:MAG TPA: aminotransferase class I/II-fold pyridoxal phosphate-dependent enzyme [Solirubrobacteraceae bacterium]
MDHRPRLDQARRPRGRSAAIPIELSTTFEFDEATYADIAEHEGLVETWYGRFSNPTVEVAAEAIAVLEGAEAGVVMSSGMGAIATVLLSHLRAGDRVVAADEVYGDTRTLLERDLTALGIDVEFVPAADLERWEAAVAAAPTRLVYAETLSNPQLRLLDVPAVARIAHRAGALFAIDNTFATPWMLRPLEHGADLVVHSATKFLNGHSDVIAGAVVGAPERILECRRRVVTLGTNLDPHAAYLLVRGLKTFEVRMERQTASALALARALEALDDVEQVIHPGLPSFPDRATAERLLPADRRGAMVSLVVTGGDERATRLMHALDLPLEATSLGGTESLISAPPTSSHIFMTADERAAIGIPPGMLRLSVGLEPVDALIADFAQALAATPPALPAR